MAALMERQIRQISSINWQRQNFATFDSSRLKPEIVLSKENRESCIKKMKLFKVPKKSNHNPEKKAAILAPLCTHNGELGFLYTLRSTKVSLNQGQVSFPGGMYDKKDASLEETAVRETWEELQIAKSKIDLWAAADSYIRKDVSVSPILAYIGEIDPTKLNINKDEVEEAFFLTLKKLCDPSLCRFTQFRDGFTLPTYLGGKHRIWGLTAAITHMLMISLVPDCYKHKIKYLKPVDSLLEARS